VADRLIHFDKEGCQIYGHVLVSRVGGNFHIAPGRSLTRHHVHVHDLGASEAAQVNLTHHFRHLSFGEPLSGTINTLDGSGQSAEHPGMTYQYYVKIVPTLIVKRDGSSVQSNQYAVTRHARQTAESLSDSGLPGVFIIYEFAPMMVKRTEQSRSFLHFLTSVCAIIGGVFTVAGIVDSLLYHSMNAIRKFELGKTS